MHWQDFELHKQLRLQAGTKATVLIYLGSTHNFIYIKFAHNRGMFVYPAPGFDVMVANGGEGEARGENATK